MGGILHLEAGIISLHYWGVGIISLPHLCLVIFVVMVHDKFCLVLCDRPIHGWQTFPKCRAELSYHLVLGPLFWKCPLLRALPYTYSILFSVPKYIHMHYCTVQFGVNKDVAFWKSIWLQDEIFLLFPAWALQFSYIVPTLCSLYRNCKACFLVFAWPQKHAVVNFTHCLAQKDPWTILVPIPL